MQIMRTENHQNGPFKERFQSRHNFKVTTYSVHRGTSSSLDGREKIQTWDISDPLHPLPTSEFNLAKAGEFTLAGDFAYQAGSGLILDLSNPAIPVPSGNFSLQNPSQNQMNQVLASDKYLLAGWLSATSGRLAHSMLAQRSGSVSIVEDDLPPGGHG